MTITDLVLRPNDASISRPRSRTSWIILFMGADSGLTMEMMRPAETRLPNPMLTSFVPSALLYVLYLFSYLFYLGLEVDNDMGNIGALAL